MLSIAKDVMGKALGYSSPLVGQKFYKKGVHFIFKDG
jgi:hypothetical protein